VSFVLIACGLAAFFARGTDNYDIDFTGGTMVTFQFDETHSTKAVKDALTKDGPDGKPFFGEDITVERLSIGGQASGTAGNYFRLRTRDRDKTKEDGTAASNATIPERVNAAFTDVQGMNLVRLTVTSSAPEVIVAGEGVTDDPAVGGFITELEFKSQASSATEVSTVTVFDNFRDALASIGKEYGSEELDALVEIDGIAGSGMKAEENSVRKFSKLSMLTYPEIDEQTLTDALAAMEKSMASRPYFDEVNSFAPSVASQMKQAAVVAIVVSLLAIVGYIWFRFQRITFGLAAVAALVHDVLVVLGMVALASYVSGNSIGELLLLNDFKINLPMIAAFLTIVGYSLNDTIVVFDRIREVRGKNPALTPDMVNRSLNQTLSRTLLTSITTFIVVAILYAFGGEGIHGFAFCLVLGVVVGTYSSIFVASPVLLWLMNRTPQGSTASPKDVKKVATA